VIPRSVRPPVCPRRSRPRRAAALGYRQRSCPAGHQSCADCGSVRERTRIRRDGRGGISHARTVVRECCKGDDESQWERGKFDKRRGSAQGSAFWGSRNQNLRFRPPFFSKNRHFWAPFRREIGIFSPENGFNIGRLESKRPLIVVVAQ